MKPNNELQAERNAEGREIAQDVAEEIAKVEGKIDKQNEAWLESGDDKVEGGGDDGKGTEGLNAQRHAEAVRLGAKK